MGENKMKFAPGHVTHEVNVPWQAQHRCNVRTNNKLGKGYSDIC